MSDDNFLKAKVLYAQNKNIFHTFEAQVAEILEDEKNPDEYCKIFCDLMDLVKHRRFKRYTNDLKPSDGRPEEASKILEWYEHEMKKIDQKKSRSHES